MWTLSFHYSLNNKNGAADEMGGTYSTHGEDKKRLQN
jgi:hypothetical protein